MGPTAVAFGSAYGVADEAASQALHHSAMLLMDEALMDVAVLVRTRRAGPVLGSTRELPSRFEDRYDVDFMKQWVVTLAVVAFKLGQVEYLPLSCVAEKLALRAIVVRADARARRRGEPPPPVGSLWHRLGDTGFLALFDGTPAVDAPLEFDGWFDALAGGPCGRPHPFYDVARAAQMA